MADYEEEGLSLDEAIRKFADEEEYEPGGWQAKTIFAEGKWPGTFDQLAAALAKFTTDQGGPYGEYGFYFTVGEEKEFKRRAMRAWGLVVFFPKSRFEIMVEHKFPETPENGWPYAKVEARDVPGGLKVELFHNEHETDALQDFLGRLLDALVADGLALETARMANKEQPTPSGAASQPLSTRRETEIADVELEPLEAMAERRIKARGETVTLKGLSIEKETIQIESLGGVSPGVAAQRLGMPVDTVRRRMGVKK